MAHHDIEPFPIVHVAIAKPEGLLIQMPEQVKGFDRNVGPVQAALQQAPETLHAARVDLTPHVFYWCSTTSC